jgi:hypothetical protein
MILSREQALERIRKPRHIRDLERARRQESRLKFHAQISDNPYYTKDFGDENWLNDRTSQPMNYYFQFLYWSKAILTAKDKFIQFANLLTFPIQTNDLIDTIADEYQKVFNAQDSYRGIKFKDSQQLTEYLDYLERHNDNDFWRGQVFNAMLTSINSIIVVDLEQEQKGDRPEPYYYLLSIDRVIDVECNPEGDIEYLIFRDRENNIVVLDDAYYTVYSQTGEKFTRKVYSPHPLGYTPAKFMWNDALDDKNPYVKQSPISSILSRLDWFLFMTTSKQCLDIYASFPIYWHFKDKCEVKECKSGFIPYTMGDGVTPGLRACPSCEKNSLVGPGSVIKVPAPRDSNSPDLSNPVGVLPAETTSLDYNVGEIERLEAYIIEQATGKAYGPTKQQINEKQVVSLHESQSNILRYIGENYAIAQKWVYSTTAKLSFGDQFIGCDINNGTKFYLQTQGEVTEEYRNSRDSGLPIYILQAQRNQITELQAKNNPTEKERLEILKYLEPYQDNTIEELKNLGVDITDPEGFVLKLNFSSFVNRFELEQGNIIEWGSALELKTKIDKINQVLRGYGTKQSIPAG